MARNNGQDGKCVYLLGLQGLVYRAVFGTKFPPQRETISEHFGKREDLANGRRDLPSPVTTNDMQTPPPFFSQKWPF